MMNDQNRNTRRMDFGAGRRQMSPEMLEAQRRLAKKQQSDRENQATFSRVTRTTTASNPARPRISPNRPTSVASGPMTRAAVSRPQAAQRPRPAATQVRPAAHQPRPASVRPVSRPVNSIKNASKMPRKEPSGPLGSDNLETLEFDSLDALGSVIAPEKPVAAKKDDKKVKKEESKDNKAKSFLGAKSPFINTLNIEKRPLSGHSVNKKKLTPKAPITPAKAAPVNDNIPTMVSTKRKSRKSNIALAIAIFLTVILGAVVGTFVYLAFFQ